MSNNSLGGSQNPYPRLPYLPLLGLSILPYAGMASHLIPLLESPSISPSKDPSVIPQFAQVAVVDPLSSESLLPSHHPPLDPQPPSSHHDSVENELEFLMLISVMDLRSLTVHKGTSCVISFVINLESSKSITTSHQTGKGNQHFRRKSSRKHIFHDSSSLFDVPILEISSSRALRACAPSEIGP